MRESPFSFAIFLIWLLEFIAKTSSFCQNKQKCFLPFFHYFCILRRKPNNIGQKAFYCVFMLCWLLIHGKYNSGQKFLGHLKQTLTSEPLLLKREVVIEFSESPNPPKQYLLWMNQHQHCIGGGEQRWTEIPHVDQHCTGIAHISLLPSRMFINSVCSSWWRIVYTCSNL